VPNPYFILFELDIYLQFALCLHHAWTHGIANLLRFLAGIIFGVLLELASIRQLHAYQYGQFLIMILDVPLCIGVAWSCILYSAMEFSEASSLPYWTRPLLDALLALNLDLALDTVAIRLGFWDWGQGLRFQYFGVPYANFWGWFWVVSSFSFGYRLFARRKDWIGTWLSPLAALIVGLIGVLGMDALITFVVPAAYRSVIVAITLGIAFLFIIALRPRFYLLPVPSLVFWIPFLTHLYVLSAGFVSGVILNPPALLWIGIAMTITALYLHRPTIQYVLDEISIKIK
jgi:uncharacterized membrane protein